MSEILVIGATGRQGGGVVTALLEHGHTVTAFVRNPAKAAHLAQMGVSLFNGSLDDPESIESAARSVDAMFAVTTPFEGLDTEVRHGMNMIGAASAADIDHLVFSSVAGADRNTRIGHFESKWEIERRISEVDVPATVIAPAFFMDNFLFPMNVETIANGVLRQAIDVDRPLQMVDSSDIGRMTAIVVGDPDRFVGERIEIAGDQLTGPEMADTLSDVTGRNVRYEQQSLDELEGLGADWVRMYEWFNEGGFQVDIQTLNAAHGIEFRTFPEWARAQEWTLKP